MTLKQFATVGLIGLCIGGSYYYGTINSKATIYAQQKVIDWQDSIIHKDKGTIKFLKYELKKANEYFDKRGVSNWKD